MSSEDKCRYTNEKRKGSNLAGSEVRMPEKAKKLKIARFGYVGLSISVLLAQHDLNAA